MPVASRSVVISLARLVRLPNVFTAISNVMMGFFFVHQQNGPVVTLALLVATSACLYMAGMVLNDLFDRGIDAKERPHRPLPSGAVNVSTAKWLGWGLLVSGVLMSVASSATIGAALGRPVVVAVALAVAIVLYDGPLKRTAFAPWLMGSCRTLNVLLGISASPASNGFAGFDGSHWAVALGIGMFVTGITWFARREAVGGPGINLRLGIGGMIIGLVTLASFNRFGAFAVGQRELSFAVPLVWPLLVALLGFSVLRRAGAALMAPTPERIKMAVKHCIFSLIVLDAAVTLAVCPDRRLALAVLSMTVPFVILTRWFSAT